MGLIRSRQQQRFSIVGAPHPDRTGPGRVENAVNGLFFWYLMELSYVTPR
ncbi:hypothetical protein ACVI1J_001751 [Bradyrhizobium diazoefficiens]